MLSVREPTSIPSLYDPLEEAFVNPPLRVPCCQPTDADTADPYQLYLESYAK